jgi:hypothetical protein
MFKLLKKKLKKIYLSQYRKYWLCTMLKIAHPVLNALSQRKLKTTMPMDFHSERAVLFAPLAAFGRLMCGMAPWFELEKLSGKEEALRRKYLALAYKALDAATDPQSPDYMIFSDTEIGHEPLVNTAHLCHALLRAPNRLIYQLDSRIKENLVNALKIAREIEPYNNNWVLFGAMVETGLYLLGQEYSFERINDYVRRVLDWYKGDGIYGDGKDFHFDYYNSFVIHPMLFDIVKCFPDKFADVKNVVQARSSRYAAILERIIAADGSYPLVGRSITYRFGAFQLLAQASLQHFLPDDLHPAQVRCALTAVIKHFTLRATPPHQIFDKNGWLRPGVYGYQPDLAEDYINIGSLYLCSAIFLPLGLSPKDPFWSTRNRKFTSQKIVAGENVKADKAIRR